ncbi:MAG: ComEC/Rec2 family competence protein [bacterium]|nr:ComEC/Rec2 family competence protein [bacterium]
MTKSKIFLFLLLSFIGGVFLYSVINPAPQLRGGIFIFGFLFLVFAFLKKDPKKIIFGFCILTLAFGVWRSHEVMNRRPPEISPSFISPQKADFNGVVVEEPDRRSDFARYVLTPTPKGVGAPTESVGEKLNLGRILVKTNLYPEYFYGDVLKISGNLETPENFFPTFQSGSRFNVGTEFDYKNYLAKDNIFLIIRYPEVTLLNRPESLNFYAYLLILKRNFIAIIDKILSEPKSSFLAALLVGARRTLPDNLVNAFNTTGTSHIVAISGYNISIISIMLLNFLSYLFLPRRLIFWIVITCILMFTLIAGAGASVVRASIMGGLLILAGREGRFYRVTNAIVFAGAAMLFFNPYLLRYDTGFQLSFLAALGLIYLAPHFNRWFAGLPNFLSFRTNLSATLSAQIMTIPVIFWEFGRVSLVATLANVLILPAIPTTMLFGFLAGLSGFISLKIAGILILPAWLLLSYQIFVVKILSILPLASI